MKKNMGTIDRVLRLILVIVVAVLIYTGTLTGTTAIILGVIAGVFLLTSLIRYCPLYTVLGLSTCKIKNR